MLVDWLNLPNAIKQFVTKQHDIYREAYGRRTGKYPRRCVFFGTTNEDTFLRDVTGNRRFWPVDCGVEEPTKSVFNDLDGKEVGQIWAETRVLYLLGEPQIDALRRGYPNGATRLRKPQASLTQSISK